MSKKKIFTKCKSAIDIFKHIMYNESNDFRTVITANKFAAFSARHPD